MGSAITRWFAGSDDAPRGSRLVRRHYELTEINKTVTEYGELLEQVSTERAHLIKTISELQIKNAELSVSKALFTDLEEELADIRRTAEEARVAIETNRALKAELDQMRREGYALKQEIGILKSENSTLRGVVTRLKNKTGALDPALCADPTPEIERVER